MHLKHFASLMLLSVFSTAAFAGASRLYSDGAWEVEDLNKKDPNAQCIAFTTAQVGSVIYRLEFAKSKKLPGPMDVQVRVQGKAPGATSYTITLKDGTVLAFADMGEVVPKKQHLKWNIPQHTDRLIAELEARRVLKFKPADGSRDQKIEFEGDGFKRVKEKMEEKCFSKTPAYDLAFEEAFILKRDAINPHDISIDQTKELRRVLNAGYALHLGINTTKDDLVKLQSRFQSLLNEKDQLINRIANLQNSEIPSIIQSQQQNDSLEANARAQLQQVEVTIGQQQNTLNAAQTQLSSARAAIAPYEAEHASRTASAYNARAAVNAGAQRLAEIDNGIRASQQYINQLSSEANSLQSHTARLDQDLRYTRQNRARAEMDARNFRPREEVERRLRSNSGYQQSLRELTKLQNSVQVIRNGLNDARGRLLARETELRVCQQRTSFNDFNSDRLPAQVRDPRNPRQPGQPGQRPGQPTQPSQPSQPNRPTPPTQPTQPTQPSTPAPTQPTTPSADCTAEINAVAQAKQVVATLEAQERTEQAKVDSVRREINQIENRIEAEVANIDRDLNQRVQQFLRQEQSIEAQINSNIRRIDQITRSEIPHQQNIMNSLSAERPSVQARYNQDVPNATRLEKELADFEKRVGWVSKVQAVQNAENLVAQRSNELNRSLSQKASLESQISRCQQERVRLANSLTDAQNRKLQAEQRLVQVTQSLVPYDQEKARLQQQESDLRNQLMTTAQDFEAKIP